MQSHPYAQLSRRAFLRGGSLFLLPAGGLAQPPLAPVEAAVRFGLLTDLHHADLPPRGNRHYRETVAKIRETAGRFRAAKADFAVELGDFIDEAENLRAEMGYLAAIDKEFRAWGGPCHRVLGNHCVWTLEKRHFLEVCGGKSTYYSFDANGFHFVVLDACFRRDGAPYGARNFDWKDSAIPAPEREWLARDLSSARYQTIAFVHQRLDVPPPYGVDDPAGVRRVLEQSGKVLAVFQGHHHRNDHNEIAGIHYCTLNAMVEGSGEENSAYCLVRADRRGLIQVEGFRRQQSWAALA